MFVFFFFFAFEIMAETKPVVVSDVVLVMSKIMNHKLIGSNYLEWSKTIRLYLSIDKDDHLTNDPPNEKERLDNRSPNSRSFMSNECRKL